MFGVPPMVETTVRRRSVWKALGVFLGILLAVIAGSVLWIRSATDREWEQMNKRLDEMLAETRGRDPKRPVLRGEAVPGRAWEEYEQALREGETFKEKDATLVEFVSRGKKADPAAVGALLAAHAVALDHLREGARRAEGQYPYVWEDGFGAKIPGLMASRRVANLAVCRSRFLVGEGKSREAAELLLDTCQFAHDLGHNASLIGEMIGLAIYDLAFEELRDLILSDKPTKEDLVEIGRQLDILDRSFPRHGLSLRNEVLSLGMGLRKADPETEFGGSGSVTLMSWRYGFSVRRMCADGIRQFDDWMRRGAEADEASWSEAVKTGDAIARESEASENVLVKIAVPGITRASRAGRERRAQLRLLRVAAHFKATGEVPDLDDPFGAKLLRSKGAALKVWSVGADGNDHAGAGGWRTTENPASDIVLEVP